jgi:glycosyltransferase involved in cell wall biosynthesis
MCEPLVSIITPSYNRDWIIENCINSIKNQSYQKLEHIIIDGGSSDQTVDILKNEEKNYNLRWISEKDEGIYDAVNKGIEQAQGDIVAYLNTDDFYFPYTIETVVDIFNSTDADIVYGDWVNLYYQSGNLEILPWMNFTKYDLLSDYNLPQPTVFIKKNVFDALGNFNLSYRLVADNEFFTRAVLAGFKLRKVDEFLASQTIHENNLLAGNAKAVSKAKEEGMRYRKYYQDIYCVSGYHLWLIRIKNRLMFRFHTNIQIVKFIYNYVSNSELGTWQKYRNYIKDKDVSVDYIKLIKYLIINLLVRGSYDKVDLAFLCYNHENNC